MPVQSCQTGGKPGFKWGDSGACYTYTPSDTASRARARGQAERQGRAINAQTSQSKNQPDSRDVSINRLLEFLDLEAADDERRSKQEMPVSPLGMTSDETLARAPFSTTSVNFRPDKETGVKGQVCGACRFYLRNAANPDGECEILPEDVDVPWYWTCDAFIDSTDEAISILTDIIELAEKSHAHDACMDCAEPPTVELRWAEGMGHAWFCESHFTKWADTKDNTDGQPHRDDINTTRKLLWGVASAKWSDGAPTEIFSGEYKSRRRGQKKDGDGRTEKTFVGEIKKQDDEKRLVYGVVLEPNVVDSQNDFERAEDIEEAAHQFMRDSQRIYRQHQDQTEVQVVQSYIAPLDFNLGEGPGSHVTKGSWVMAVYIPDAREDIWQQVKRGDLTGFSIRGFARRDQVQ